MSEKSLVDLVITAAGILHYGEIIPEKSLRDLSLDKFHLLFEVNTILPALIMKHFIPRLDRKTKSVFAALSHVLEVFQIINWVVGIYTVHQSQHLTW